MTTFAPYLLIGLLALAMSSLTSADTGTDPGAAPPEPEADILPDEERDRLRERASDLKAQSRALREKTDAERTAADGLCWQRTFVASCLEEADAAQRKGMTEVRKLDLEARDIERDLRTRTAQSRRAEKQRSAEERRLKSIEMSVKTRETDQQFEQDAKARAQKDAEAAARAQQKAQETVRKDAERAEKHKREDARAAERAAHQQRQAAKIDERIRKQEAQRLQREADAAAKAAGQASPRPPE